MPQRNGKRIHYYSGYKMEQKKTYAGGDWTRADCSLQIRALPNVEAYRCTSCRLVLFHYRIPQAEITPKSFLKKCAKCAEEIPIASEYCPKCGTKQEKQGPQRVNTNDNSVLFHFGFLLPSLGRRARANQLIENKQRA